MIVNKTIYIRDEDVAIWDKAKELAGDKLAPVIVDGLRKFIVAKEAEAMEAQGFQRIEVSFPDAEANGFLKRKAFVGKWIFTPDEPCRADGMGFPCENWALALTPRAGVGCGRAI